MTGARAAYSALAFCALPFAALYLLWRSRRQPEYRAHWAERFGLKRYAVQSSRRLIWLHAVSLGETRGAGPLVDALAARYPQYSFVLTHMTPTGRAAGAEIAARWPGRILQTYLPYDVPYAVRRFLRAFNPALGLAVETEIWPNLLAAANSQDVPVVLVNARLSERSYRGYRRFAALMREATQRFSLVLAQTDADAARLRQLGADSVDVTGNVKFDLAIDEAQVVRGHAWRRLREPPVWLFASTREGEEALLLDALPAERSATVIIVPRHPQRFDEVARLIEARGLRFARRSNKNKSGSDPDLQIFVDDETASGVRLFLGDTLGEMALYYAAADVAFIGGSLIDVGGQNLIEACAVGTPVVVGPYTFNFEQATVDAIQAGAAVRAQDARGVLAAMSSITNDPVRRWQMSESACSFSAAHRGATARTVARLAPFIDAAAERAADSAPVAASQAQ